MLAFTFAQPFKKKNSLIFLYNLFIQLYYLGIRIAALGGGKPQQWLVGRKH